MKRRKYLDWVRIQISADPELQKKGNAELAHIFSNEDHHMVPSTVSNWRRKHGWPGCRDVDFRPLYADPDFGLKSGIAEITFRALGERHGISEATVQRHAKNNGIERSLQGLIAPRKRNERPFRRYWQTISDQDDLLRQWRRPEGMDEHLETLRD